MFDPATASAARKTVSRRAVDSDEEFEMLMMLGLM